MADGSAIAAELRAGNRSVAAEALNLVENRSPKNRAEIDALLAGVSPATLGGEAAGHIVGVTGPPGAGKSTLLSQLVSEWRKLDRTVAVLAVDPSSRRSGGALLGDRARITYDPHDSGVFIRSMAAGDRLGGLAAATRDAAQVLVAAFDVVVVETVGVGQSETEIADIADTVVVVVQPGSGDVLQFLKSGIMEIPDVLAVTKADLGDAAVRSVRDLRASLRSLGARDTRAVAVSAIYPTQGIDQLIEAVDAHRDQISVPERRRNGRILAAVSDFQSEHGERALREIGGRRTAIKLLSTGDADRDVPTLVQLLLTNTQEAKNQ